MPPYSFSHPPRWCSSNQFSPIAASSSTSSTTLLPGLLSTQRRIPSFPPTPSGLLHWQQHPLPLRSRDVPQTEISTTLQWHQCLLRTCTTLLEAHSHLLSTRCHSPSAQLGHLDHSLHRDLFSTAIPPSTQSPLDQPSPSTTWPSLPSVQHHNIPTTRHGPIGMSRLHRHRRRLERRHTQECILDLHLLKTLDVLHLLHRLGSDTKEKLFTSQVLRSHSTSTEILYLLWSQHFHIDEPWRSRAASQLKLIFRFRNLMIPPTQATLRLFQLSHGFLQRCHQHFRAFLQLHSQLFPPLQVPASPIIEVKSHTLEHYLFTFRTFLRPWDPGIFPPVCLPPDST